ncbi:MAG: 3-hydroxyacyl-CoA dehydrogenase [Gammaproteobacteria bacterium]|nr:3-hydroxyacyl-CoA dehydrogenase [Gammaproteobacteria bacterium]MBU1504980.1 3-hydroxyacyl-CoA dehydrogenase [Gammaproteobacteria bacterium]MBU2122179.1 3-hydroxyacyl-CoA dehydrogenase [Gammaproteobacteria bacterium]MBU2172205.1 3-hydroxyacyl-CoA dehydrogenase [Gammaproteobacteria bacterium]MBU2198720.1 3-hydroxyacyl-CoA dehydrogenase [Gammaproteobacteria bacterium]
MALNVQRVAVVATGVIGASWAAYFLARGLDVDATDPSPGAEQRLRDAVQGHWSVLTQQGLAVGASMQRLCFHVQMESALERADFVQESGPERLDFKIELFRRMDAAAPAHAILASSSSGLSVTAMQSACGLPERVVLGHPFNPPHMIPLVEVGGGQRTSPQAIADAMDFYAAIGKRPIYVKREIKGHIANRLQAALWREAFHLVSEGVASVTDIDTAIAHGPGLRWALMGPFMNLHLSGGDGGIAHVLDHLGGPIEDWWRDLGAPSMSADLQRQVVDGVARELGQRSTDDLVRARDALLIDLLRAKQASSALE